MVILFICKFKFYTKSKAIGVNLQPPATEKQKQCRERAKALGEAEGLRTTREALQVEVGVGPMAGG